MQVIVHVKTSSIELTCYRDPGYYNKYHRKAKVSEFVQSFEGLDLQKPQQEKEKASCGLKHIHPGWERWLSSAGNWCAWREDPEGWIIVADGRRHGIPWPKGTPLVLPGRIWDPEGPWLPPKVAHSRNAKNYHDPSTSTYKTDRKFAIRLRRLGLPVPETFETLWGMGTAPTVSWAYLKTERPDMLYWQNTDDLEQIERYG